ncbi:hypothetical protein GOP47_0017623 [Adiantum capillus-veneris]|uniref:Uncharacterized protein n=1 Tax=Adiantum capillus-veneris TaxID=13818 RepID=A0A9D4UFZ9_ADICA|nr:hypothetical protein GOP47_0017623 [Adiantum capillus-veneris]
MVDYEDVQHEWLMVMMCSTQAVLQMPARGWRALAFDWPAKYGMAGWSGGGVALLDERPAEKRMHVRFFAAGRRAQCHVLTTRDRRLHSCFSNL